MAKKSGGFVTLKKFDNNGNEVPTTKTEQDAAQAAMRDALRSGQIVFAPQVLEQLKKQGLTQEQIESWIADATDSKQ